MRAFIFIILLAFSLKADEFSQAVLELKMNELAATYSEEKIKRSLKGYDFKAYSQQNLANKAFLVDLGAISLKELKRAKNTKAILSSFIADFKDHSDDFLGNILDQNIIEKMDKKYETFKLAKASKLQARLDDLLAKGQITGYNIKNKEDFLKLKNTLKISYGHNDLIHANQLLALLKSEKINAKVQIEPKTSAFLHKKEWGEPAKPNKTLKNGQIIITPLEFDLIFLFKNKHLKTKAIKLINKYAKRDKKDQKYLIYDAWWVPMIVASKTKGFSKISFIKIAYEDEIAVVISLIKDDPSLKRAVGGAFDFKSEELFVNPAFYRFLKGFYK